MNERSRRLTGKPGVVGGGVPAGAAHVAVVRQVGRRAAVALHRRAAVQRHGVRVGRHAARRRRPERGVDAAAR